MRLERQSTRTEGAKSKLRRRQHRQPASVHVSCPATLCKVWARDRDGGGALGLEIATVEGLSGSRSRRRRGCVHAYSGYTTRRFGSRAGNVSRPCVASDSHRTGTPVRCHVGTSRLPRRICPLDRDPLPDHCLYRIIATFTSSRLGAAGLAATHRKWYTIFMRKLSHPSK